MQAIGVIVLTSSFQNNGVWSIVILCSGLLCIARHKTMLRRECGGCAFVPEKRFLLAAWRVRWRRTFQWTFHFQTFVV